MSETTQTLTALDVDVVQRQQAREVEPALAALSRGPVDLVVMDADGQAVPIPVELGQLLRHVIRLAANERPFGLVQFAETLTSVEASKMLGISRPTLIKWAKEGRIDSHLVGSHRRFARADVLGLASELQSSKITALDDLRTFEDELGIDN